MTRQSPLWAILILLLVCVGALAYADHLYFEQTRADNKRLFRTIRAILEGRDDAPYADGL